MNYCEHIYSQSVPIKKKKKDSFNTFLLLYLPLAPPLFHCWPSLSNQGQLAGTGCHPTSQMQGQCPPQRLLFGQLPPSFHGEPTGTPQLTHGQDVSSPIERQTNELKEMR